MPPRSLYRDNRHRVELIRGHDPEASFEVKGWRAATGDEPQTAAKNSGPPTDAGATNFVRSTQAHSGLQCPELAQLRPQIVPWSTLCRADWVRNDPVLTTRG